MKTGQSVRPWRLVLDEPVALENAKGQPGTMWVHEVSCKGVLLEVRNKTKAPKHFALWFSPSGYERIALRGTFEKETEQWLLCLPVEPGATRMKPSACASSSCSSTA
jgi:hypothetical protein